MRPLISRSTKIQEYMSHFTVMVIGDNPEKQLAPFNENLEVEFNDKSEEYRNEYETETCKEFYCGSSSSWGFRIEKDLFIQINESKKSSLLKMNVSKLEPFSYLTEGKPYKGYHLEDKKRCEGNAWFRVHEVIDTSHPDKRICFEGIVLIEVIDEPKEIPLKVRYPDYDVFLSDWHGIEDGEVQGHWHNPKAKWDWYSLGGRWSGMIKLKGGAKGVEGRAGVFGNETGIDQARLGDISNIADLKTFAVLKDSKWYERGKMGWFGVVIDDKDDAAWHAEIQKLLNGLPNTTLISIYDCRI